MHWRKLIGAARLFPEREPRARFYSEYMERRNPAAWESDIGPSDYEIDMLFTFLNQWSTRYQNDEESRGQFRDAYVRVLPMLRILESETLVEASFDAEISGSKTLSRTVQEVFETLATAGRRYELTGTSKILHTLRPDLFVMWDYAIRVGYGVGWSSGGYADHFLRLMQREAHEAVDSYVTENQSEPRTAVEELEKRGGSRPITKLVDEYNYCKFTLKLPELWE